MGVRKGVFYSFMVLALTLPLMLLIIFYSRVSVVSSNNLATKVIGEETHNFIDSVARDFPRALYISGRSSIAAVSSYVMLNAYLTDGTAGAALEEIALSGSLNDAPLSFMEDNYFLNWSERVKFKGVKYGLNVSIDVEDFSVKQFDSFNLLFNATITVNASSPDYNINFSKQYSSEVLASIEGVVDPFYYRETLFEQRLFSANTSNVLGEDAFEQAIDFDWYTASEDAPCFLDRLEGNAEPSGNYVNDGHVVGLETIVNLNDFYGVHDELVYEETSVIDHAYFNADKVAGCNVTEFKDELNYNWIRLDWAHASRYGLTLEPC